MNNKELKHHGIKGMKWGVRRDKERFGRDGKSPSDNHFAKSITKLSATRITQKQRSRNIANGQKVFAEKFEDTEKKN